MRGHVRGGVEYGAKGQHRLGLGVVTVGERAEVHRYGGCSTERAVYGHCVHGSEVLLVLVPPRLEAADQQERQAQVGKSPADLGKMGAGAGVQGASFL